MKFPIQKYADMVGFAEGYFRELSIALDSVETSALRSASAVLEDAYERSAVVYVCGNGGSAAIANHFVCDHAKGIPADTKLKPRVVSLSSNVELITAIANDVSYADVFAVQLRSVARTGDVLITISASGDSENVVRAAEWAVEKGLTVISMTGFAGGRTAKVAHINLHVDSLNYGVVEDVHQSLMHILAQYLRQKNMDEGLVALRTF